MAWQSTPWADPLLLSTVVSATLAVFGLLYVLSVRHDRRVIAFATLMIGTAVWTLGYSFQFASADLAGKRIWVTVATVGEAIVPVAWFTFALLYARRGEWLTPGRVALLWSIPVLTIVLAVTNANHGLVWAETARTVAPEGGYYVLETVTGPWITVHGAYSYLVGFGGVVLLIDMLGRTRRVYRGQAAILLGGVLVPGAANLASLAGVGPATTVDLTPPSMAVLGVAFAVGIFKYRLFDLVPIARSSVVENMGEGYVLLDDANEVVDLNAAARALLDGDEGNLLGRDAHGAFGADLSVLETFDGDPVTETVTMGEGEETRYIDLTVSRIEADRVTGRLLGVRDVTDRIQVERRFRRLIEASSDMVFVLDEAGVVDYASPSVEGILGHDPGELEGRTHFEELLVEDDRARGDGQRVSDADSAGATSEEPGGSGGGAGESRQARAVETWRRVLDGSDTDPASSSRIRFEVRVRTADGETRTIEAIARYLVDDPAVEGIVINARDVTERKQRELELERTNERLDQFASFVSHDLRNPLNVAMGHLDLAMDTGDEESLRTVRRQHERMETMIEDLLSMARDGRTVEDPEMVDLHSAVTRAWESVDTGDAALAAETTGSVRADGARLPNLLENLFRNSVEHGTGEDGDTGALTVRVESLLDGFAVEDDGVGIPPDVRDAVTESGYTTESGNTGYGLAIVDEIATAHGWEFAVMESDDGGARFTFTGVETRTGSPPEGTASEPPGEPSAPGGGE